MDTIPLVRHHTPSWGWLGVIRNGPGFAMRPNNPGSNFQGVEVMKWMKRVGLIAAVAGTFLVSSRFTHQKQVALAQSGSRGSGSRIVEPTFESKFWDYLRKVQYENWAPGPGQGLDFYPGKSPHGAHLKMYLNRVAAADPGKFPYGSIIVKENYDKDKKLAAITVMYRPVKGYDPDHNDWYWVKYNPDGTVARTPATEGSTPIAGKVKGCIDCHSSAKGGDYYFANDK